MESPEPIRDQAARWLVKKDSADWSESDQAALRLWLESSTAHVVAYLRLEAAWKQMGRLKSLGAGVPAGAVPSPDQWQLSPVFKARGTTTEKAASPARPPIRFRVLALAASIAGMAAIGTALFLALADPTYRTPVGGIASVPMADGSKVTLNTDSTIKVSLTESRRRVRLEQGEAFFEVAKDPSRPFVVVAGRERITAVGTAFSVRRDASGIRVVVTDGKVKIEEDGRGTGEKERGRAADAVFVSAGSVARSEGAGILVRRQQGSAVEDSLSWRKGFLVFQDTSLADAVTEFNRYNTRHIEIADPSIGAIKLTGKFEPAKYEAFVRLLEDGFAISAQVDGERIVLVGE
jgi:transmembrane sensor